MFVEIANKSTMTLIGINQLMCVTRLPVLGFIAERKSSLIFALKAYVVAMSSNDHAGSSNEGKGIASKRPNPPVVSGWYHEL